MNTEIQGYYYSGDCGSVADYGGKWIGITKDNLGEVIEVIGMSDLEDGDDNGAIIQAGSIYVRGHVEMRAAIDSCGWDILSIADRAQRHGAMLEAYVGYWGFDTRQDFGGPYEMRVMDDDAAIEQANRWAR